jgi:DNA-binding transcriptional ArsR family regulator
MEVFDAVAQPTRREILRLLAARELSAGEIGSRFALSQPAISQHLKVLRQTGLISERRDGTRRLYTMRSEGLAELHSFIAQLLPAGLERLKQAAEAEERRGAADATRN